MSHIHTLAEVKTRYGQKVVETATSFVVNDYGKYRPNISFVLSKDFVGRPLRYRCDAATRKMVAEMNFEFNAAESTIGVLFGDFWLSKAGKPHFRPKSNQTAEHVLLAVNWGGAFARSFGRWDEPKEAIYFRHASSNGGGLGIDYYVFSVGFHIVVQNEEHDGGVAVESDISIRAAAVRAMFAELDRELAAKAAAEAKAKAEAQAASRELKPAVLPQLMELQVRLNALRARYPQRYSNLEYGESYFSFERQELLFSLDNVKFVEQAIERWETELSERDRLERAKIEFRPRYEMLAGRVKALGLTVNFTDDKVKFSDDDFRSGYSYTADGLKRFEAELVVKEEQAVERARERAAADAEAKAQAEAAEMGLPSNLRIRRNTGVTNAGDGWVIRPDGSRREHDPCELNRYGCGDLLWKQVMPGEVVLRYSQADRYAFPLCEVVYRPDALTQPQLATVKQLEQELEVADNAFGLDEQLGELLDSRAQAIEEAMLGLPELLWPDDGWTLDVLSSANGLPLPAEAESWVKHDEAFEVRCNGREAQVVYELPAADGMLQVVAYYKFGRWNLNMWWREADVRPAPASAPKPTDAEPAQEAEVTPVTLEALRQRFNG
jgi:hypothetical protein